MIINAQGDGKSNTKTGLQNEHVKPINFTNIGLSKISGHGRMKSDIREYQNNDGTERNTFKKE